MSKVLKGIVVSNKMDKTIVVKVFRKVKHKVYVKIITRTTKYFVHDEKNICSIGDLVFFQETVPMSKKKHWILVENSNVGENDR